MDVDKQGIKGLTPLQKAYYTILKLKEQLAQKTDGSILEPIAIIGMACRFPGDISSPEELWKLLYDGTNAISEIPEARWSKETGQAVVKSISRWAGMCNNIMDFDPHFFGISTVETYKMDPQHRLLMMVAWETFENAGIPIQSVKGSDTGVFIGQCASDYLHSILELLPVEEVGPYIGTGNSPSAASGRIAYQFGFEGPALTIDTACSSSLVAIHNACQNLNSRYCDMALAGGVNLIINPYMQSSLSMAGMLSPDGQCKTFDNDANGYVRAEGCGLLLLKPLTQALKDGNKIHGVIKSSYVNQDGSSGGLTVPNMNAQEKLIRKSLNQAGLSTVDLDYIEAHGTGTKLGDPIEVDAWQNLLSEDKRNTLLPIGSVKTNLGHCESAAGIAGMMKAILTLNHRLIPPHLNFTKPNQFINWDKSPLTVPTVLSAFEDKKHPLNASVSSFGFTGTLANVIIQEPPEETYKIVTSNRSHHILKISAKTGEALKSLVNKWCVELEYPAHSLEAYCSAAALGRDDFSERAFFVAQTVEELKSKLSQWRPASKEKRALVKPKTALLFTGQGSQYVNMAKTLYERSDIFSKWMDKCDAIYSSLHEGTSLIHYIFDPENPKLLHETKITQPALFSIGWSLYQLWKSWGLRPAVVMGHSIGEFIAVAAAGAMSLEDALKLVITRGSLMQSLPKEGSMASVFATEEEVSEWIGNMPDISIAAVNAKSQIVVSGDSESVKQIVSMAKASHKSAIPLKVSHAFHSPLMDSILEPFGEAVKKVKFEKPVIDIFSNVTGEYLTTEKLNDPAYWMDHIIGPVRFYQSINKLKEDGYRHFLEIGPRNILSNLTELSLESDAIILSSLQKNISDWQSMLETLGVLYTSGCSFDWKMIYKNGQDPSVRLPNYPFQTKAFWIDEAKSLPFQKSDELQNMFYETSWEKLEKLEYESSTKGSYLIIGSKVGMSSDLSEFLVNSGNAVDIVPAASFDREYYMQWLSAENGLPRKGIIYLAVLELSDERMDYVDYLSNLLRHLQVICDLSRGFELVVCTRGALGGEDSVMSNPLQASTWGLMNVFQNEQPNWKVQLIDLDSIDTEHTLDVMTFLLSHKVNELRIKIREKDIYLARFGRIQQINDPTSFGAETELFVNPEGSYIITGGSGALGRKVVQWLADNGARELIILASSAPDSSLLKMLSDFHKSGIRAEYLRTDLRDFSALEESLKTIESRFSPPKGIFHLAGRLNDSTIAKQEIDDLRNVLEPKLSAAWNLHKLSTSYNWPLDHFVLFSSVSVFTGTYGQSAYAAANFGLDALAAHRKGLGLPALSIQWGPWAEIGVAAKAELEEEFQRYGVSPIMPEKALVAMERAIKMEKSCLAIFDVHWKTFSEYLYSATDSSFFEEVMDNYDPIAKQASLFIKSLNEAYDSEQTLIISDFLNVVLMNVLGDRGNTLLNYYKPLTEQGFDSLLGIRFAKRINNLLALNIPPTTIFVYPSINQLSGLLQRLLLKKESSIIIKPSEEQEISKNNISDLLASELEELM